MNCPYCGRKMEKGYLQSTTEILYTDAPHRVLPIPRGDDLRLTTNRACPATCGAWRCAGCREVIIGY